MRVVATSDLHGERPTIPRCDLLLIAGDVCPVRASHSVSGQRTYLKKHFGPWLASLPADDIVWIAGNHDYVCEHRTAFYYAQKHIPATYLQDSSVTIQGKKIYGTPWVPHLPRWAFHRSEEDLRESFKTIPDDIDILMLHGPPYGIMDRCPLSVGAPGLANEIFYRIRPELVVFGHIHEGYGYEEQDDIKFANAAHMDGQYNAVNRPIVIDL